jgi:GTP-binding protein
VCRTLISAKTITDNESTPALPAITVDEPTISLQFLVNNSPFAGREGTFVTGRQIRERLELELETNVGLKVDFNSSDPSVDGFTVYGRGELHIAILVENMRREGYELQISQPKVIIHEENGEKLEPFEEVIIDCPQEYSGTIIETLGKRKGIMKDMKNHSNQVRMVFRNTNSRIIGL